jgi:hypothetical protein
MLIKVPTLLEPETSNEDVRVGKKGHTDPGSLLIVEISLVSTVSLFKWKTAS